MLRPCLKQDKPLKNKVQNKSFLVMIEFVNLRQLILFI